MIDRNVEFPNRFQLQKVPGTDDIYDIIPAPGDVIAPGDLFSKGNMLPDEIVSLLGLKMANPQVKDALNVLANVGNLHVWQRVQTYSEPVPEVPAGYTLGEVETNKNIVINTYGSDAVWYQTASSVAVDGSGNVSLVALSSAAYFYVKDLSGAKTLWAGKFVLITNLTNDNQYALPKGTIFFVPSDGNLKSDSNNSIVYVTKYQSVTGYPYTPAIPAGTYVDYLTSTDRNAYPDQSAEGGQDAYYTLGDVVSNYDLGQPGSNTVVTYSSDIVVSDDGVVTMVNPNSVLMNNIGTDAASTFFGKFVKTSINDSVVFIPVDATASYDNSSGFSHVILSKYQPVTGHAAIPANTTITYLGQLGGGARIEVGSYVGTGTYGRSNPNSLTFVGIPKLVIVEREQASGNVYSNGLGVFFYGQKIAQVDWSMSGSGSSKVNVVLSWNQNAVSWYGNDSSAHLNDGNATYHYIAIG